MNGESIFLLCPPASKIIPGTIWRPVQLLLESDAFCKSDSTAADVSLEADDLLASQRASSALRAAARLASFFLVPTPVAVTEPTATSTTNSGDWRGIPLSDKTVNTGSFSFRACCS